MNQSLEKRIAALEARLKRDPVVLVMADGTRHIINGSTKHFFALYEASGHREYARLEGQPLPEIRPSYETELDWIRDCVDIEEPANLFQLIHALCHIGYSLSDGTVVSIRRRDRPALREAVLAHARGEKSGNEFYDIACKLSAHDRGLLSKSEAPE